MLYKELTIHIPSGLKSKGASMLTHVAGHFESQILIECENKKINAKSIMGVLSLGIVGGTSIRIIADGSDEEAGHEIADRGSCNRTWRTEYPSDRRSKLHGFRGRSAFSLCVDESRV